jgi:predicted flap endonuclease-1-like 5' DNA nuclease
MNGLSCCLWWFVFGVLLGWLLNWLFSKLFGKNSSAEDKSATATNYTVTRVAAQPVTSAPAARGVDLDAARRAGFQLRNADDLAVIDGIGPKIEELFREHGVITFAQVAKMSAAQMQAILDAGGPNYKLANPATWAQQAQLILDNRWGDLKKLHDELAALAKSADPHKH